MPASPCPPACPHCRTARSWRVVFWAWFLLPLLPIVVTFAALSISAITRPYRDIPPSARQHGESLEDWAERNAARMTLEDLRRRYGAQALH